MRPLYALTFQIDGNRLNDLIGDVSKWVASKYADWDHNLSTDGTTLNLGKPEHEAQLDQQDLPNGRMFSFTLSHPDRRTQGLCWHTAITVATDDVETECDLVLSTYVTRDGVQPPPASQVYPPFLQRIIERYPLRIGKEPLALKPDIADVQDIGTLVDILLMPQRRLPLVLVSNEGGEPLVAPDSLQDRLLGTARVVHITPAASFYLSDQLGRLSCYDGGVRIYWPGFQLGDDEYFHKLYFKWEIRDLERSGRSLADDIFDRITSTSSIRVRRGPLLQRLRKAQEKAKEAEFKRRLAEIGARDTVTLEAKEAYEELLTEADENMQKVMDERDDLLDMMAEKECEANGLRWKVSALQDALRSKQAPNTLGADGTSAAVRLSKQARQEYAQHVDRQSKFNQLLKRLVDPVVRDEQVSRCSGGGFVYPRSNSDERVFFEMDDGVVHVCALFPHHQDSLATAYKDLRSNGVQISDFDDFELWELSK